MGNSAPTGEVEGDEFAEFDGIETLGYRVLGVQPNSPASKAGLVSFFDFILGANGEMLLGSGEDLEEGQEYDDVDFPALLRDHKGKVVELLVWNIKAQQKRLVELTPSDEWDGAGLLGVTIKMDNYGGADERLIRVLEVEEGSPASLAGLVKDKDFMLGTTTTNFSSSRVLASVLELHIDELVEIYVYNSESDMVRVVALMPNYTWGGRGMLGAEVGTGYIHGLPNKCRNTIGQSVERKVRWTGKSTAEADAGDQGESTTPAAAGDNGTFEMEPHLEMELDVDNSEEMTLPESSTKQPHELGTTVTGPVSSQEPVPPTVDPHPVRTQPISTSEAPPPMQPIPSAPAPDTSVQPPSANPTPPMPPPPAGNSTGAASVFAAAPPISNQAANPPPPPIRGEVSPASLAKPTPDGAVYGIPAPPKMTY